MAEIGTQSGRLAQVDNHPYVDAMKALSTKVMKKSRATLIA